MGATHSHVCRAHSLLYTRIRSPKMRRLELALKQEARRSEINVGKASRRNLSQLISSSLPRRPRRLAIISNPRVFSLYGRAIARELKREGFKVFEWLMPEGERYK